MRLGPNYGLMPQAEEVFWSQMEHLHLPKSLLLPPACGGSRCSSLPALRFPILRTGGIVGTVRLVPAQQNSE